MENAKNKVCCFSVCLVNHQSLRSYQTHLYLGDKTIIKKLLTNFVKLIYYLRFRRARDFLWITKSSDHGRDLNANLLHATQLPHSNELWRFLMLCVGNRWNYWKVALLKTLLLNTLCFCLSSNINKMALFSPNFLLSASLSGFSNFINFESLTIASLKKERWKLLKNHF